MRISHLNCMDAVVVPKIWFTLERITGKDCYGFWEYEYYLKLRTCKLKNLNFFSSFSNFHDKPPPPSPQRHSCFGYLCNICCSWSKMVVIIIVTFKMVMVITIVTQFWYWSLCINCIGVCLRLYPLNLHESWKSS